jgi:hypothetical protein
MLAVEDTFAVVVNWNGGAMNHSCLRSLRAQGVTPERTVFVDNGSRDGSAESVRADFPGLRILSNSVNEGFAKASNQGLQLALELGAELVLFLNNDVELPPGALEPLIHALERDPRLGIVGPRIAYRNAPGLLWCAGGTLNYRQNLTRLVAHRTPDSPAWRRTLPVDFVPGCTLLVRRTVLERIGGFDPDFFAYHEDVDFCLRARARGFGVACVGEALALHEPHSSTGGGYNPRRKYMMGVNSVWFLRRHGTPWRWARFLLFDVLSWPVLLSVAPFRGRTTAVLAKGRGILDGIRGRRVTREQIESGPERRAPR